MKPILWIIFILIFESAAVAQESSVTSSLRLVEAKELEATNILPKPEQIKCIVDHDPQIALFVRFDMFTAQCLKHRKITKSHMIYAHFQYGRRIDVETDLQAESYISTFGYEIPLNNPDDLAELVPLTVNLESDGSSHYQLEAMKVDGNLGRHGILIDLDTLRGWMKPANDSATQNFSLTCEIKYSTKLNGREVSFEPKDPISGTTISRHSAVGC